MTTTSIPAEVEIVERFNELIDKYRNSDHAFKVAADSVRQPDLKRLFDTYSKQRRRFATELQIGVVRLGGTVESHEDDGVIRRDWPRHNAGRIADDSAVIGQCAHAEDRIISQLHEMEAIEMPAPLRTLVDRHSNAIVAACNRIHELQQRFKKSA